MNYRKLGHSGLKVSEICLGAWINFGERIDDPATFAVLDAAVDEGINFFDTADVYAGGKAEQVMGRWMKDKDRRTLVVATKSRWPMWAGPNGMGNSRKHIMDAVDDSLRRLDTGYIDLYQMHAPDPDTPPEETLRALDDLVRMGKVRYFGWSNHDAEHIVEFARLAEKHNTNRAISLQNCHNMLTRDIENRVTPACVREEIGQVPYSPLAQGLLSDKYIGGEPPADSRAYGSEWLTKRLATALPVIKQLAEFAKARDITLSQLALAWLLHQPAMTSPIIGATKPAQVKENAKASDVKLSADELAQLDTIIESESKVIGA